MKNYGFAVLFATVVAATPLSYAAPAPGAPPGPTAGTPPPPVTAPGVRYDWQGNHKKAQAALNAKDYKTAIQLFTEILNSGRLPKAWLAPTLYFRGKAYRLSRQLNLAIADYEGAVKADPKMDIAFFELGATFSQAGQHGKAVGAYTQAIALKSSWDYYYGRCTALAFMSRYNEAIRDCEVTIRMKPGRADILAFLGRLYEETGQKQRAIEMYKLALSINPNQQDAREGLTALTK